MMKKLHLYQTADVDELAYPEKHHDLTLESTALAFFTDFETVKPLVIDIKAAAVDVIQLMHKAHVRMKLVVDENGQFQGIVSSDDLIELKLVQKVSEGFARDEIPVTEFMTRKNDLKALDFKEISTATIADVIRVLKDSGQQHCLVVDHRTHKIRGVFSASDISRRLHLPIDIQDKSNFYKVFSETA